MKRPIRAVIIDSVKREFREVTVCTLSELQRAVGGLIETATYLPNGDCVYVDEEGLFKHYPTGFVVLGTLQPFVGSGIIVGATDDEGDSKCAKSTIEELQLLVHFLQIEHDHE